MNIISKESNAKDVYSNLVGSSLLKDKKGDFDIKKISFLVIGLFFALIALLYLVSAVQEISTVTLNSTSINNLSSDNLTATVDPLNASQKYIYDWKKDNTSIAVLNMPFEGGSNSTFTKDYSDSSNNGTVTGPTFNVTGGYDGFGAYEFDGVNDYIDLSDHVSEFQDLTRGTIISWFKTEATNLGVIFAASDSGDPSSEIRFYINEVSDGKIHYSIREAGATQIALTSGGIFNDGAWHLAARWCRGRQ